MEVEVEHLCNDRALANHHWSLQARTVRTPAQDSPPCPTQQHTTAPPLQNTQQIRSIKNTNSQHMLHLSI